MRGISTLGLIGAAFLIGDQRRADSEIVLRPSRIRISEPSYAPRSNGSKLYKPNGRREVARRLRQIERGQLQVSA